MLWLAASPANVHLVRREECPVPWASAAVERQACKAHAVQVGDTQPNGLAHAPNLTVAALLQHEAQATLVVPCCRPLNHAW